MRVLCVILSLCAVACFSQTPSRTVDDRLKHFVEQPDRAALVVNAGTAAKEIRSGKGDKAGAPIVLDIRDEGEFHAGSLPGAISAPFARLSQQELPNGSTGRRVLIVGESGNQAVQAMVVLRLEGINAYAVDAPIVEVASQVGAGIAPSASAIPSPPASSAVPANPALISTPPEEAPFRTPASGDTRTLSVGLAVATLAVAGILVYFLVIVPQRRLRPVRQALAMLDEDQPSQFEEVDAILHKAVTSGLSERDLADVRFALAYVRARLGRAEEALSITAELMRDPAPAKEAIYLDLWVQNRTKHYEAAESRFAQSGTTLGDLLDSRLLGGIALLEQAFVAVGVQDYQSAVNLFERLEQLGVLKEHVPTDLANQQVAFAVDALFDSQTAKARESFAKAAEEAFKNTLSVLNANVGLVLCDWREDEEADVDATLRELVEQASELQATGTPDRPPGQSSEALVQSGEQPSSTEDHSEPVLTPVALLTRNIRLLFAVSLLRNWKQLPAEIGLPDGEKTKLLMRLAAVREVDPAMGDPLLLQGLIQYYFADSEAQRQEALSCLEQAAALEVTVPEVYRLMQSEKNLAELQKNKLRDFLSLLKHYLEQETVPLAERRRVQAELGEHAEFRGIAEIDLEVRSSKETSMRDIASVSGILIRRVERLVDNTKGDRINELLEGVKKGMDAISNGLADLDKKQGELVTATGEYLLKEEVHPDNAARTTSAK